MKEVKKIKLEKLNFYFINENYINYLSKFDKHIAYNKNETRPYIGILICLENQYYFAPLFSPKNKHKMYKDNLSFFKIISLKTNKYLGMIRFTDMIPVPKECLYFIDISKQSYGYKRLLAEQYSYINMPKNKKIIISKAKQLYKIVTSFEEKSKTTNFYKNLSCNFRLLEEKCVEYEKEKSTK